MKTNPNSSPLPDSEIRIVELIRALHGAEWRLQHLAASACDGDLDPDSKAFLLKDAREAIRAGEAIQRALAETQSGILDALPAQVAVLNSCGTIIAVNESWRRFGLANALRGEGFLVGQNYLKVCDEAHGKCSEEAAKVASGIRDVLAGKVPMFSLEYPCHSPGEQRWFRVIVSPLHDQPDSGAVVLHIDATDHRIANEALIAREHETRSLSDALSHEIQCLRDVQEVGHIGTWEMDLSTFDAVWSEEMDHIFESDGGRTAPSFTSMLAAVHPEDRGAVEEAFHRSFREPGTFDCNYRLAFEKGSHVKYIEQRWRTICGEEGKPGWAEGTCKDVTEWKLAEDALATSQRRYRDLVETSHDLIWAFDANGIIQFMNRASSWLFDRDPEEMVGHHFREFVAGDQLEKDEAAFRRAIREGREEIGYITSVLRKDGSVMFLSVNSRILRDVDGSVVGGTCHGRDVTRRVAAQKELKESEERFRLMVEGSEQVLFYTHDHDHIFTYLSPSTREVLGYEPDELAGVSYDSILIQGDPKNDDVTTQTNKALREGHRCESYLAAVRHKDGRRIILEILETPVFRDGKVIGIQGFARDITARKQAEEQLRLLETCVSRLSDIVVITEASPIDEPGPRIVYVNDTFVRRTGFSREEAIGKSPRLVQGPDTDRATLLRIHKALEAGKPCREELVNYTKSGEAFWVELEIVPVADSKGTVSHWVSIERDITERRLAEADARQAAETLARIVAIQQEIANANTPLPEILDLMARRAQELTGATGSVIEFVEGDELVYRAASGSAVETVGLRLKSSGSLSGLALSTSSVLQCDDAETDPRVDRASCQRIGLRSMIVAPLRAGDEIIGVLKVLSDRPGAFHERAAGNLQVLTETLGVVIQRQRTADALKTSMAEFKDLAQAMPQIVWVSDAEGATTFINQNWTDYTGQSPEDGLGSGWIEPFHPDERTVAMESWRAAVATGRAYSIECRLRRRDGEYRWWLIRAEPRRDPAGKLVKWFGTCTDIDDLKVAELEILRTNRALKTQGECNEALIHASNEADLLKKICEIACNAGGYRMAWVGYPTEDENRTIRPVAHAGHEDGYLSEITLSWDADRPEGNGPAGRVIRNGNISVTGDIASDPCFGIWRDTALKHGDRGVICLPLREGDRTFGMLSLHSGEVVTPNKDEFKLLQELADNLSFGITSLRTRSERERLHESILAIARGVSASVGLEFFERLNENLVAALHADAGFIAFLNVKNGVRSAKTVSAIVDGKSVPAFEYDLEGTPCEQVSRGEICLIERNVQLQFPADEMLAEMGIEAYAGTPLLDSAGEAVGLMAVVFREPIERADFCRSTLQIFAARAASEMARQQADARVREQAALLDCAHEAILVKNIEGRIIYWNKGAERTYGYSASEAIGKEASELLHQDPAALREALRALFIDGQWEGELINRKRSGEDLTVEARWTLMRDAAGHPTSILAITTDITEKKKLERQFLRAQRVESIGTLAGGIAHDLNNALAPIMISGELLRAQYPENTEILDVIEASVRRGAGMVRQLLSFAKGAEGERALLDPARLIREIEQMIRGSFPKNIQLVVHCAPNLPTVTGDATQLHQVLLNLCVNARDTMPLGGTITLEVECVNVNAALASSLHGAKPGAHMVFRVTDTGTGIRKDIVDRIFDPFFTTKGPTKGTGLGLSTATGIVKGHGGFIQVTSEPGSGSTFSVYIPANRPASLIEPAAKQVNGFHGGGEFVLLVDDEPAIRETSRCALLNLNLTPLIAGDGSAGLGLAATHGTELRAVVTDLHMPEMDGIAFIRELRRSLPSVPVIVATGLVDEQSRRALKALRVVRCLNKPFTQAELAEALQSVLSPA